MKIEFNENNTLHVSAIIVMLSTINKTAWDGDLMVSDDIDPKNEETPEPPSLEETPEPPEPPSLEETADDELDNDGYPYDSRIHAKTRTKNADGTWKVLRRPVKKFANAALWDSYVESCRKEAILSAPDKTPEPPSLEKIIEKEITYGVLLKKVTKNRDLITEEDFSAICEAYEITTAELSKPENRILLPAIYQEVVEFLDEG